MTGDRTSFRAPWATSVRVVSLAGTLLLGGITSLQAIGIPTPPPAVWPLRIVLVLPAAILLGCALSTVRGYALALPERPVVVTPDDPGAFLREPERCCPGVRIEAAPGDTR